MKDFLNREVCVGDHLVYSKTRKTSLFINLVVVLAITEKSLRVMFLYDSSGNYRKGSIHNIYGNFVKVPLEDVEPFLLGIK